MLTKILLALGFVGTAVVTPVAGMSVSPVREALLGLAPGEQIVKLADEIDKSRVENQAKIAELQATTESQQARIAEYEAKLSEHEKNLEKSTINNSENAEAIVQKALADDKFQEEASACKTRLSGLNKRYEDIENRKDKCIKKHKDDPSADAFEEQCKEDAEAETKYTKKALEKAKEECAKYL